MFISDGNKATSKLIKRSSIRRAKRNSINEYKIPKFTDRLRGVEPTDEQQILKSSLDLWGRVLKTCPMYLIMMINLIINTYLLNYNKHERYRYSYT